MSNCDWTWKQIFPKLRNTNGNTKSNLLEACGTDFFSLTHAF